MGVIVSAFVCASLAGSVSELRLVGAGMFFWACGAVATGLARSYPGMIIARVSLMREASSGRPAATPGCSFGP